MSRVHSNVTGRKQLGSLDLEGRCRETELWAEQGGNHSVPTQPTPRLFLLRPLDITKHTQYISPPLLHQHDRGGSFVLLTKMLLPSLLRVARARLGCACTSVNWQEMFCARALNTQQQIKEFRKTTRLPEEIKEACETQINAPLGTCWQIHSIYNSRPTARPSGNATRDKPSLLVYNRVTKEEQQILW